MLFKSIIKADNAITLTTKSRVSRIGPVTVSTDIERMAKEIVNPPASAEVTLKEVERSPVKSMLTIRGQIVAVSIMFTFFFTT